MLLSGCAHSSPCIHSTRDTINWLECRAATGDKFVQLELAKRYETGNGVAINLRRAAQLYGHASRSIAGTTYIYSPSVGKHGRGMVLPIRTGLDQPGLAEAQYRLGLLYLEGRGVRLNPERGYRLIKQAAEAGFRAARAKLEMLPSPAINVLRYGEKHLFNKAKQ